mmetsp:Transcript_37978/g.80423  ORF Transcript_37978/g.80423 Transcript_37978/m.80423 type:complete len:218 (-) Transcript_37978:918-1571(-)
MWVTGSKPSKALPEFGAGQTAGPLNCTAIMSASLPTAKLPILSPKPKALAPFRVAILRAVWAGTATAFFETPFAKIAANFISAMTSKVLFDEAPSVPMATLMPASMRLATSQNPLASLRLLLGQWTTLAPPSAVDLISCGVSQFMCTAMRRSLRRPKRFRFSTGEQSSELMWQDWDSLLPALLASTSSCISWRWMCRGTFSFSERAPPLVIVASEQV